MYIVKRDLFIVKFVDLEKKIRIRIKVRFCVDFCPSDKEE